LQVLSGIEQALGDDNAANRLAAESLALFRDIGFPEGVATALNRIGSLARGRGDDRAALAAHSEALLLCASVGERFILIWALTSLCDLASRHNVMEVAAMLLGAIDTLAWEAGATRQPAAGEEYDLATTAARDSLGEERFAELRAGGQRLRLDDAVTLAQAIDLDAMPTALRHEGATAARFLPEPGVELTRREREILGFLCQRQTNAEIAARLFISPRTVGTHVANLLAKLGAANRRQAASIAVRHGLISAPIDSD
jgi:DNA-binding CsgD family transcriptional regulator